MYPGSRSRRGEWDQTEMSSKNSESNRGAKRSKRQAGSGESKGDSITPSDSSKRLEQDEKKSDDPFRSPKESVEKTHRRAANDWVGESEPLIAQMEEHTEALKEVIRSGKFCARCEELATCAASLATHHLEEAASALREYSLRYQQALRDLGTERRKKEDLGRENEEWLERVDEMAEENEELDTRAEEERKEAVERLRRMVEERKEMEREMEEMAAKSEDRKERLRSKKERISELELERDQLRAALATREENEKGGRTPPPRDIAPEEVEMRGGTPPSFSSDDAIIQAILGPLEEWFEVKWGQMASQLTPSSIKEVRSGAPMNAKKPGSWARAVGRKAEEKPSPTGTASPRYQGARGGAARTSPAARGGRPEGTERSPSSSGVTGRRRKEKRWPALPGTAVVAINPIPGGTLTGGKLMREAQQALSLEELEVPPLEIKRSKMEGYLLGLRGQGAEEKADRLADGLRGLPGASGVAVTRPVKRLDIRSRVSRRVSHPRWWHSRW